VPPAPPAPPPPPAPAPPAPPAPAPAPAPAPEGPKTYTVEDGDTLSGIAAKTLGDGERWNEIFDLNRDQIDDANVIHPGQVLKLPGGADVAPAPAPAPSDGSMGSKIVDAARALKADGYHYTVNLTSNYHPVRFKVGCCADFAIDSWAKAGKDLHDEISNPHYVPTIMTWMKNHGEFSKTAKPGDMVFFDWDGDGEGDHTAIVTEVDGNGHATKIIESYDFNLPVRERAIGNSADNIMGYAHP
jgi:LysM repeat protein